LPAVAVGLLIKKYVDMLLERVDVVAVTLLVGGIVLLFVDRWFAKNEETSMTGRTRGNTISYRSALVIGFFQCIAMVPGVSRSAATIIGGLTQGLNRKAAAEFSFFLAVPTMFAATVKSLWDEKEVLAQHSDAWTTLLIGNVVAFLVAMAAIRFFIGFLTRYGFVLFGWYRIVLGLVLLILLGMGIELKIAD
jgi:undecaprenyl-diphosphatase